LPPSTSISTLFTGAGSATFSTGAGSVVGVGLSSGTGVDPIFSVAFGTAVGALAPEDEHASDRTATAASAIKALVMDIIVRAPVDSFSWRLTIVKTVAGLDLFHGRNARGVEGRQEGLARR
jgi:hypothetical protein